MWQDFVLTIINFGFVITAIPAVLKNYKMKEAKSQSLAMYLATAVLLTVMAYVFYTLDMPLRHSLVHPDVPEGTLFQITGDDDGNRHPYHVHRQPR
jgi:hypothetical protein